MNCYNRVLKITQHAHNHVRFADNLDSDGKSSRTRCLKRQLSMTT